MSDSTRVVPCGKGFVGKRKGPGTDLDFLDEKGEWLPSYGGPPEAICTKPFLTVREADAGIEKRRSQDLLAHYDRPVDESKYGTPTLSSVEEDSNPNSFVTKPADKVAYRVGEEINVGEFMRKWMSQVKAPFPQVDLRGIISADSIKDRMQAEAGVFDSNFAVRALGREPNLQMFFVEPEDLLRDAVVIPAAVDRQVILIDIGEADIEIEIEIELEDFKKKWREIHGGNGRLYPPAVWEKAIRDNA